MARARADSERGVVRLTQRSGEFVLWEDTGDLTDIDGVADRMQLCPRVHSSIVIDLEAAR